MQSATAEEEVGSHAGTLDLTAGAQDHAAHPDSSRHYSGPTVQRYKYSIVGWVLMLALVIASIVLGANSLQKSNEALALATKNEEAIVKNSEMVLKVEQSTAKLQTIAAAPAVPTAPLAPALTPATPKPTGRQPTDSPTETHELNPQWFHTDHIKYTEMVDFEIDGTKPHDGYHSHLLAGLFCSKHDLTLCPYSAYCPNGKGNEPFQGGPPKTHDWENQKEIKWSPFLTDDISTEISNVEGGATRYAGTWVQVGRIPGEHGGSEENDYAVCYTWETWMNGAGGDIEETWSEDYRSWILCCERQEV